jgi:hypothetical protein
MGLNTGPLGEKHYVVSSVRQLSAETCRFGHRFQKKIELAAVGSISGNDRSG